MDSIADVPNEPGTYVLGLHLVEMQTIAVGNLGTSVFAAGIYGYVGSAFGPGGLRARPGRHVRGSDTLHWHIDYVRAIAEVRGIWYCATRERLECCWSQALATLAGATIPVIGFGASDCDAGCTAHLIGLPDEVEFDAVHEVLATTAAGSRVGLTDFGRPPNMSTIQGRFDESR